MTSFIWFSIVLSGVIAKDCFNPDGSLEKTHLPCVGDAANTHCCPPGSTCLTNGLCLMEVDSSLTTGSCTEKYWNELACFHTCFGALGDDLSTASTVYRCDGDFWCCSGGTNSTSCCSTASNKFALKQGSRALIQNGTSFNKGYTLVSIADLSSTSSTPPASPSSPSSTPVPSAQPAAATSTDQSPAASGQFSSNAASAVNNNINSEKLKVGLGTGLGIGLPLLIALLASILLLTSEKKANRKLRDEMHARGFGAYGGAPNPPLVKPPDAQPYRELPAGVPAVSELAHHY